MTPEISLDHGRNALAAQPGRTASLEAVSTAREGSRGWGPASRSPCWRGVPRHRPGATRTVDAEQLYEYRPFFRSRHERPADLSPCVHDNRGQSGWQEFSVRLVHTRSHPARHDCSLSGWRPGRGGRCCGCARCRLPAEAPAYASSRLGRGVAGVRDAAAKGFASSSVRAGSTNPSGNSLRPRPCTTG